jgi:hypothetical protein
MSDISCRTVEDNQNRRDSEEDQDKIDAKSKLSTSIISTIVLSGERVMTNWYLFWCHVVINRHRRRYYNNAFDE